jgi:hypothetical protein
MSEAVVRTVMVVFLILTSTTAIAVERRPAPNVKQLSEQISLVLQELDLDVPSDEVAECLTSREEIPHVLRMVECFQSHGGIPELAIPSDAEIAASTRPMLIRTSGNSWFAMREPAEGFLRPVVPEEAPEVRIPVKRFHNTWSGVVIFVGPIEPGQPVPKPAEAKFESVQVDFGKVPRGKVAEVQFPFRNVGGRSLRFKNVAPEKKLIQIQVQPDLQDFLPGSAGVVVVTFDTKLAQGPASVTADLLTNDPERMLLSLELKGEVVDPVATIPEAAEFGPVVRGATAAKEINLVSFDGSAFGVVRASPSHPSVTASVSGPKGSKLRAAMVPLRIVVDSSEMDEGEFEVTCEVELTPEQMGSITVPVSGTVVPPDAER